MATINLDDERQGLIEVALLRIALLSKARDVSGTLEDVGEGSNGWEIVCAFAERGKLGFKEEAKVGGRVLVLVCALTVGSLSCSAQRGPSRDTPRPLRIKPLLLLSLIAHK